MPRPSVDIIVPFVGSDVDLAGVIEMLEQITLGPGDTVTIADNRPTATPGGREIADSRVVIWGAAGQPSSYFARNRGVERGQNPWLVFLDADVTADPGLLAAYFATEPGPQDAILVGGIHDEPAEGEHMGPLQRHAERRGAVSHETTLRDDEFSTAQTANLAVRRSAFEQLGGFTEGIRSGGDADFCLRATRSGFAMVPRFEAAVTHHSRSTFKRFAKQYARYGSGAAWLEVRHPGFAPRPPVARWMRTVVARFVRAGLAPLRGKPDESPLLLLDAVKEVSFYVGRLASNEVDPTVAPAPGLRSAAPVSAAELGQSVNH